MHDVFISYSTKNKNIADAIVADFEQHEIKCWYAPRDIIPGEEWVSAITSALEQSKALVLIYTDESNKSRQVMNEIAVAFNAGITIVPFKLSDEEMSSELEYYLTRVHWMDAVTKPLKENISALREYMDVIIHTPYAGNPGHVEKRKPKNIFGASIIVVLALILVVIVIIAAMIAKKHAVPTLEEQSSESRAGSADEENTADPDFNADENDDMEALKKLGDMYYEGSDAEMDEERALQYYINAEAGGLKDAEMFNRIGLILFSNEDYEQAAAYFVRSVEMEEDVTVIGNAALAYDNAGDSEKAVEWYQKAIDGGHREAERYKKRSESLLQQIP